MASDVVRLCPVPMSSIGAAPALLAHRRLDRPGGQSLTGAYARTVLRTRGAGCYRRGHGFQFNLGQGG